MGLRRLSAASLAFSSLVIASSAHALVVTPTDNAQVLVNALMGAGSAISVTSVSYSGAAAASGTYTDGPLGMGNGALLTSGSAMGALPPNDSGNTTTSNGLPGHPLCDALIPGYTSQDASVLSITFDLASAFDGIQFNSVFGSEEYPEWVGSNFNDVYGVYLNGQQVAFDDNGNPITINGPFFSGGSVVFPPANGTEYDGTTGILNTRAPLAGGSTGNVLEIVICDAGDQAYDSGAFLTGLNGCVGNDCSGTVPCAAIDNDGDGVSSCDDCDDGSADTYPGAPETCDTVDNDCDGTVDEGGVCAPTCVTIQRGTLGSVQDATIYPNSPNLNDGASASVLTGNTSVAKKALVRFDLGVIPSGAAVTSASFGVYQVWSATAVNNITLHQILAAWQEGTVTSGNFANAYDPAVLGFFTTVQNGAASHAVDVTDIVGDWVAGLEANHGFLLEESAAVISNHTYRSSEHPTVADRPYLHVCYVGGGSGSGNPLNGGQ
ncbi:MAG TPA: choice-of-anchor L domain-containing protein [Candidatus Nanopelagicales bacterium]|nr:choice-of-anchor L domain-containing protein [Candidatus Nanopelagicales bacterium]